MLTSFMYFKTADSQEVSGLPGGLFHCDGLGTVSSRLVSLAGSDLAIAFDTLIFETRKLLKLLFIVSAKWHTTLVTKRMLNLQNHLKNT